MRFPFLNRKKSSKSQKQLEEKEKSKGTWKRVCPNCLSDSLKYLREFTSGWLTPPRYYCSKCQYAGQLFLEIDIESFESTDPKDLKAALQEKNPVE